MRQQVAAANAELEQQRQAATAAQQRASSLQAALDAATERERKISKQLAAAVLISHRNDMNTPDGQKQPQPQPQPQPQQPRPEPQPTATAPPASSSPTRLIRPSPPRQPRPPSREEGAHRSPTRRRSSGSGNGVSRSLPEHPTAYARAPAAQASTPQPPLRRGSGVGEAVGVPAVTAPAVPTSSRLAGEALRLQEAIRRHSEAAASTEDALGSTWPAPPTQAPPFRRPGSARHSVVPPINSTRDGDARTELTCGSSHDVDCSAGSAAATAAASVTPAARYRVRRARLPLTPGTPPTAVAANGAGPRAGSRVQPPAPTAPQVLSNVNHAAKR